MKLNLGCGRDIKDGYINVDVRPGPGVDVVHDLGVTPWPWDADSVDEIVSAHALQQIPNFVGVLNECHRVLKPGAQAVVVVPYYTTSRAWADPANVHRFCEQSFAYASRTYREAQGADHTGLTCHFDPLEYGFEYPPLIQQRSKDARDFMVKHYMNAVHQMTVWLTKAA